MKWMKFTLGAICDIRLTTFHQIHFRVLLEMRKLATNFTSNRFTATVAKPPNCIVLCSERCATMSLCDLEVYSYCISLPLLPISLSLNLTLFTDRGNKQRC